MVHQSSLHLKINFEKRNPHSNIDIILIISPFSNPELLNPKFIFYFQFSQTQKREIDFYFSSVCCFILLVPYTSQLHVLDRGL